MFFKEEAGGADLDLVALPDLLSLHPDVVDPGPGLASEVLDEDTLFFGLDPGVVLGDDRVIDLEGAIGAPAEKDLPAIRERFGAELGRMKVTLVVGGDTRSRSVRNALAKVTDRAELVCVHDAVRPCVSPEWIDRVFAEAARTGAAILACPVHGTLKRAAGGLIRATLPREEFWEAQTPQVFRRELLREAYAGDAEATDDAHLVERLGRPVSLVPGDPRNVKITTPADLAFAEAVIGTLPTPPNARRAGT